MVIGTFVITLFAILMVSLAAGQVHRRRRLRARTPEGFPPPPEPQRPLPPDRRVTSPEQLADVYRAEHEEGRHVTAPVLGCVTCQANEAVGVMYAQRRALERAREARQGPAQTDLRVSREGDINLRVTFREIPDDYLPK